MAKKQWEYGVGIKQGCRLYLGQVEPVYGLVWFVYRSCLDEAGEVFTQSLIVSPEVFDTQDEAERDVLEKLTLLALGRNAPLQSAIQWILES